MIRKITSPNWNKRENRHGQNKTGERKDGSREEPGLRTTYEQTPTISRERKHSHKTNHRYFSKQILLAHRKIREEIFELTRRLKEMEH